MIDIAGFLTPGEASLLRSCRARWGGCAEYAAPLQRCPCPWRCRPTNWPSAAPPACALQEVRIAQRVEALEQDTGIKLRVLAQNYPETPGKKPTKKGGGHSLFAAPVRKEKGHRKAGCRGSKVNPRCRFLQSGPQPPPAH